MKWPLFQAATSLSHHFRALLRACARRSSLGPAKKLHALALTTGLAASPSSFLCNTLLHVYASCGELTCARKLFDGIPDSHKDNVDWTVLMGSLARHRVPFEALRLFVEMGNAGARPDDVTLVCLFNACARLINADVGMQGHGWLVKMGFESSTKASNALMDVYVKSGLMSEARRVFFGMEEWTVVSWTVFLDGVIRWEGVLSGRGVFDQMPERNEVASTVMLVGYVESGYTQEAFSLLHEAIFGWCMRLNSVTLCSLLSASAQSGDVMMGKWVHVYALKTMGKHMDVMVGTTLLDMYAKCGRINTASKVFEYLPVRNAVTWNAIISGLAMHGLGKVAVGMFPQMLREAKPDDLTFTSLLNACSHSGLLDEGRRFFHDLQFVYGIRPKVEHYACMVDLLGRAGEIEEAEMVIKTMPVPPNEVVLGSLLGSCHVHGKLQLAERILNQLVQLDPQNTEYHVLLSNMYALEGKLEKANSLRHILRRGATRKVPGISFIHTDGKFHQFSAGDKSHPRTREIYVMLDEMIRRLRLAGYSPNTSLQLLTGSDHVFNEEEKEQALFSHSEKLAVCFGLISTRARIPLYIMKNLRICQDCHAAIKIVSDIYEREIVIRDRSRFHHFKHGSCSCCDYR
ncbi:pentatricopeptide repeat-containing protein At5g15340, mitochondrial [Eucalyptus grandis]|uniref:pentatricopeptide repeat-containing protein At5g15340, mitochondrial n=1 Tax=Eucalyptus grandis TaxID=71139 RepID=UPI00192EFB43|nr:pentatricopeptide repeat-containing protein At5g15340, mitochondrial [Eucalyptus grandis]XP_039158150.1 pentatricopeptide repeat-containing protein At5g15340, mitochondrial [Eucalyptus grandis]XP_039158151.1 pentatricopeptide repeat-containing protein At5g15340, mitochondrial [Eucalyptus grandis]